MKQRAELGALRKRVQAGRLEHNRQRKLDLERLLQRYANVKMALEKQQGREMTALTRKLKAVACVAFCPSQPLSLLHRCAVAERRKTGAQAPPGRDCGGGRSADADDAGGCVATGWSSVRRPNVESG